eukprot:gb/GEZJ01002414.1/.p1 GENE.gb/GEZJ01002414.1/~~gb/GEZJ01002414.1/.p1  ORF type:complete len:445 (-),score=3.72 gb/GEZJ01002414.1/:2694-4028(-)
MSKNHPISLAIAAALLCIATAICPNGTHPMPNGPPGFCLPGADGCPPGTLRRPKMFLPGLFATVCDSCSSGFSTFQNDARRCRRIGFPCPSGHLETASGDCWRCYADERFDHALQRCVRCPTGTGSAGGLPVSCAPCSSIVGLGVKHSRCSRGDLFVTALRKCPPGSKVVYRDSANVPLCKKCPSGFLSAGYDSAQCDACPENSISPEGSRRCVTCPRYTVANDEKTECLRADTGCPIHSEPAEVNGQTICRSTSCGNGDESFEAAIGRVCGPCDASPWKSQFLREDGQCGWCPKEAFSDGLQCTTCPRGQVRLAEGGCGCRGPLALHRGVDEHGNCARCPPGSYGEPGPNGEHVCTMCPAGTRFFEVEDSQVLGCFVEVRCTPFRDLCARCPSGSVSIGGSLRCEQCPEGTFTYGEGESKCLREGEPSAAVPFNDPFGDVLTH